MGIEVLPPSVNVSSNTFTIEQLPAGRVRRARSRHSPFPVEPGAAIRMGLDAIKNVGEGPVDVILQARGGERPLRPWPTSQTRVTCARSTAVGWSA